MKAPACFLAIALLFAASGAVACSCVLNTPLEQLAVSDIVVTGSVTSVTTGAAGDGTTVSRAQVAVESVWKGSENATIVVETIASGTCAFTLEQGTKYLIYANRLDDEGRFATHYCMRTQPAEFADTDFEELGAPLGPETGAVPATWGFVKSRY